MTDLLYAKMGLPDRCRLGKRVFKKLFQENAKLGVTDKKAFRDDIDTVWWQYTLKPSTIPVQPYEDGEREYLEIAVLQVDLKTQMRTGRIAEVIHRAVPYPVFLVLGTGTDCAVSVAHKRFSLGETERTFQDFIQDRLPEPHLRRIALQKVRLENKVHLANHVCGGDDDAEKRRVLTAIEPVLRECLAKLGLEDGGV